MEDGSKSISAATLPPPTIAEIQEIVDILKDPPPDQWGEGWQPAPVLIASFMEQDPEITEDYARSRLKTMVRVGKLEKISHRRRAYYRVPREKSEDESNP